MQNERPGTSLVQDEGLGSRKKIKRSGSVAEQRNQDPELNAGTQRARLKFKKKQYGFQQSKMVATGSSNENNTKVFYFCHEYDILYIV